jgi:hypothetical protein
MKLFAEKISVCSNLGCWSSSKPVKVKYSRVEDVEIPNYIDDLVDIFWDGYG